MTAAVITLAVRRPAQSRPIESTAKRDREASRDQYYRDYGERLRVTRAALNIPEADAAATFRVTLHTYQRWEAGERSNPHHAGLIAFAEKYDVTLAWLLGGDDTGLRFKPPKPAGQAQSEPALDPDQAYLARLFYIPAYKSLPFVTLKEPRERTGAFNDASSYWNDVPTDDEHADNKRGEAYAQMAVAAIEADQCRVCRGLELTFEHIYLDAIQRREKGGKYSRSMPQAAVAFLGEIAKVIYARAKGEAG